MSIISLVCNKEYFVRTKVPLSFRCGNVDVSECFSQREISGDRIVYRLKGYFPFNAGTIFVNNKPKYSFTMKDIYFEDFNMNILGSDKGMILFRIRGQPKKNIKLRFFDGDHKEIEGTEYRVTYINGRYRVVFKAKSINGIRFRLSTGDNSVNEYYSPKMFLDEEHNYQVALRNIIYKEKLMGAPLFKDGKILGFYKGGKFNLLDMTRHAHKFFSNWFFQTGQLTCLNVQIITINSQNEIDIKKHFYSEDYVMDVSSLSRKDLMDFNPST